MEKGIYIVLSGAIARQKAIEISSQNLGNATTVGYKREKMSFRSLFLSELEPVLYETNFDGRKMNDVVAPFVDFTTGTMVKTGKPFDFAIEGDGFFVIEGGLYTRKGLFTLDRDRYLKTWDGRNVLGEGIPIRIPEGELMIKETGEIYVNNQLVTTIDIVDFPDKYRVNKLLGGYYISDQQPVPIKSNVRTGYLEQSNVEIINEMANMINLFREFETYQKAIQTFDTTTDKVVNEMAKV